MTMKNAEKIRIPITAPQALPILNVTDGNRVHSFWAGPFLSGADLEFVRAEEMVKRADEAGKLFLSNELGGVLQHDIIAWDFKYQKWTYLECTAEKAGKLMRDLR